MPNYSELSTYHEIMQNFPHILYSFRVTKVKSQNFETITENKFTAREKGRQIDVQKLKP